MLRTITRKDLVFCVISGLLLALAFSAAKLWLLAWVSFVPLLLTLRGKSPQQSFWLSFLTGFIFWLATIYWLVNVTIAGMVVLALYLALYFALFGFLTKYYQLLVTDYDLLIIPSIWVILEFIRSKFLTGFGWALLGYSQANNLTIIQIADITGVWGVSFLVMLFNAAAARVLARRSDFRGVIFVAIVFFLAFGYGAQKLFFPALAVFPYRVSLIQGNIPQSLKWDPAAKDFIIEKYLNLTGEAVKDNPDIIIWPEASLPALVQDEPQYYQSVAGHMKKLNTPLLLGVVTRRDERYFNSAFLVDNEGKLSAAYDKLHLVPFGEYIPLRKIFPFLEAVVPIGDFSEGKAYTIFSFKLKKDAHQVVPAAVLICFEDVFPQLARDFTRNGAKLLVNITNDGWFGKTTAAYQHLQASVFRAVENRRPLVRSANTGVSAFINENGRAWLLHGKNSKENIFVEGVATRNIYISESNQKSIYTRFGDFFILIIALFVIMASLLRFRTKGK